MPPLSYTSHPRPIVMLSPMAGYTTSAYRTLVKEIAPHVLVTTELVGAEGLIRKTKGTMPLVAYRPPEQPIVLQLVGHTKEAFVAAAKVAEELGFAGIDINMGCPAKKVVRSENGSALILKPALAFALVEALAGATSLPVSVKTRLGYADSAELLAFAKGLESAGARMLVIHGRTVQQRHSGEADWDPIYDVQGQLSIPVLGNGGVEDYRDGVRKQRNLAGFTIGRSALGNPWVFLEEQPPDFALQQRALMLRHVELLCADGGGDWGVMEFRKWLPHYCTGLPNAQALRHALNAVATLDAFRAVLAASPIDAQVENPPAAGMPPGDGEKPHCG